MSFTLYRPMHFAHPLDRLYNAELAQARARDALALPLGVFATENDYVISAVVPGLKPEDLHIEIKDQTITIEGETKAPEDGAGEYLVDEIRYGKFARTLSMNADLDGSKAEAHVENGLLTLRIPKAESAKPKVVKVLAR
jgi:HSP20 family protein